MDRNNRYIPRVIDNDESPVRRTRERRFDFSPRQALYYNDHPNAIIEDFDHSEYGAVLNASEAPPEQPSDTWRRSLQRHEILRRPARCGPSRIRETSVF